MKFAIALVLAALGFGVFNLGQGCGLATCTGGTFQQLQIGGGGFVLGVQTAPDGSQVATSDSAGPWYRSSHNQKWQLAINSSNFPDLTSFTTRCLSGFCYNASPGGGIDCAIAIAPGTPSTLYFYTALGNGSAFIYKNTNGISGNWTKVSTGFPTGEKCWANGSNRFSNPRMAVDPQNASVVYLNTPLGGIYYTTNGGIGWNLLTSVPPSIPAGTSTTSSTSNTVSTGSKTFTVGSCTNFFAGDEAEIWETGTPANQMTGTVSSCSAGSLVITINNTWGSGTHTDWSVTSADDITNTGTGGQVAFDPSDGTGNTVYVTSQGSGVWECTSASSSPSCSKLTTASAPTTFRVLRVDSAGTVWVADTLAGEGSLFRFKSGAWTEPIVYGTTFGSGRGVTGFAIDPTSNSPCASSVCVYAVQGGGCLVYSTNAQTTDTFTGTGAGGCMGSGSDYSMSSTVIPWFTYLNTTLSFTNLATDYLEADPTQTNVVYASIGRGLLKATAPHSGAAATSWNADETAGIENLDLDNAQLLPAGHGIIFSAQDLPAWFTTGTTYPSTINPPVSQVAGTSQACGNANAQISMSNDGIIGSTNYGSNWQGSFTQPTIAWVEGNCVPVDATHWIWVAGAGVGPHWTTNSGTDSFATSCTIGNSIAGHVITVGGGGWYDGKPVNHDMIDMSANGTIMMYNNGSGTNGTNGAQGLWVDTSGTSACSFTQVNNTLTTSGSSGSSSLRAAPGTNDFWSSGLETVSTASLPGSSQISKCTTGGSCTAISTNIVKSFFAWGFGAPAPGGDGYPSFACACWVSPNGDGTNYTYGIWESDNMDQATPTFTNIDSADSGFPAGNFDQISFLVGDNQTYGTWYVGFNGSGGAYRTLH